MNEFAYLLQIPDSKVKIALATSSTNREIVFLQILSSVIDLATQERKDGP